MTDTTLRGEVNQLRNELRAISTKGLRAAIASIEAAILALEAIAHSTHSHGDLTGVGANDHHNQVHAVSGADHTGTLADAQVPESAVTQHEGALEITEAQISDLAHIPDQGYTFGGTVMFTADDTFDKGDYPGLRAVKVRLVGGGGGGGGGAATAGSTVSAAAGGGGGGYAESFILVSDLDTSEAVTVGQGGAGVSGGTGNSGTDSVFDTVSGEVRGEGGTPGSNQTAGSSISGILSSPGGGGTGDLVIVGSLSGPAWRYSGSSSDVMISDGGDSHLGSGGRGRLNATASGGNAYGGGGGGSTNGNSQSARAGGDGADGVVLVDLYF